MSRTVRVLVAVVATALLASGLTTTIDLVLKMSEASAQIAHRDCSDFFNQQAAQYFFLSAGGPYSDPHRLDSDGDGIACETLPCPCFYGRTPPPTPTPIVTPTPTLTATPTVTPTPIATATATPSTHAPPSSDVVVRVVEVVDGQLIRIRQGSEAPLLVHLLGLRIPKGSCESKAAVKDLRSWVKPGMAVKSYIDQTAPSRDPGGHPWRALELVSGGWDIGGSQIDTGFASVERRIRFSWKNKYLRWERKAITQNKGYHRTC